MQNFNYQNPVKIVFGKNSISQLNSLVPDNAIVLITYGGGSIKNNGVYQQVMSALEGKRTILEFGGIEPNPQYETCMKAVEMCKGHDINFIVAVGGGSVIDGTKFIAAAAKYEGIDPWDILAKKAEIKSAIPLGAVLTLPATGSEMNPLAVISRESTKEKLHFGSSHTYPLFSILDPETTYSLPSRQLKNGIVDTFVHVLEQYVTTDLNTPLQDRQAEAILKTILEITPRILSSQKDYDSRASFMWCATQALNGHLSCGVAGDWATHMIGHELTAFAGIDHGQSLAIVIPGVWKYQFWDKCKKLAKYAINVWDIDGLNEIDLAKAAIVATEEYFEDMGMFTRLGDYDIDANVIEKITNRFKERGTILGENNAIDYKAVREILISRL